MASTSTQQRMLELLRVPIAGVPTQILQHVSAPIFGKRKSESDGQTSGGGVMHGGEGEGDGVGDGVGDGAGRDGEGEIDTVLVVVPGNPGIVTFYEEFAEAMYEGWDRKVAVVVTSHVGHVVNVPDEVEAEPPLPSPSSPSPSSSSASSRLLQGEGGRELSWDLESQVAHKVAVLDAIAASSAVSAKPRFILAGHSIGGHIVNELLLGHTRGEVGGGDGGEAAAYSIVRGINLFPTLHSMRAQAGILNYITMPGVRHATSALAGLLGLLPRFVVRPLLGLASDAARDERTGEIVANALSYSVASAVLGMAATEFAQVEHPPDLDDIIDNLVFYYGVDDGWAPIDHAHAMRQSYPSHPHVHIDDTGAPHAFVVDASAQVAQALLRLLPTPEHRQ